MSRAAVFALLFLGCGVAKSTPLQEKFEQSYPLSPTAAITIRNTDGTIYVYGSEVNELKVFARKKAYSKERLDGISIKVSIDGDKVSIDTIYPPGPRGLSLKDRSGTVDYVIVVPQTCSLPQVELGSGEIIVDGLRGPAVNARLTNGIIWAQNCFSAVHLTASEGKIAVEYDWWETGMVSLLAELAHGEVSVLLPPDPAVRLDAASVSGRITNQFGQEHGQSDGRTLRTTIGAEDGAEFKIRTNSGNIKIERGY